MNDNTRQAAAFIDFDGTICEIYLWQCLFAHHRLKRFKLLTLYAFIAFHFPIWLLYEAKILSKKFFHTLHATNLAWLIQGVSIPRSELIWDWVIENQILPRIRPEMKEIIRHHQNAGREIFLISGSFQPLLDKLAVVMGLDGVIATPLEKKNNRYTGKIIPPLCIGDGKTHRLLQFLESQHEIDLSDSYFYTDSNLDLPVMELFGHPGAVYPDEFLAREAQKREWPIID